MSSNEQPTNTDTNTDTNTHNHKHYIFHNPFSHSHRPEIPENSKDTVYNPPYIRHPLRKPHSNASAPASEAAESGKSISEADLASYAELMEKTKNMMPEETKAYLASLRDDYLGSWIMRGEPGYMQLTGAFAGTM